MRKILLLLTLFVLTGTMMARQLTPDEALALAMGKMKAAQPKSTMDHVPPIDTLQAHIVARNAIVAIWDCGRQERSIAELQQLAKDGFPGCKKVFSALSFKAP